MLHTFDSLKPEEHEAKETDALMLIVEALKSECSTTIEVHDMPLCKNTYLYLELMENTNASEATENYVIHTVH